jgi:hypothetical protein
MLWVFSTYHKPSHDELHGQKSSLQDDFRNVERSSIKFCMSARGSASNPFILKSKQTLEFREHQIETPNA